MILFFCFLICTRSSLLVIFSVQAAALFQRPLSNNLCLTTYLCHFASLRTRLNLIQARHRGPKPDLIISTGSLGVRPLLIAFTMVNPPVQKRFLEAVQRTMANIRVRPITRTTHDRHNAIT